MTLQERAIKYLRTYFDPDAPSEMKKETLALSAEFQSIADETWEEAARLHESIKPASDDERIKGHPGAGAMGAVIEYRDALRARKSKP